MGKDKKLEYNEILKTLNKKINQKNRDILSHIENNIFKEEKKQEHHKDNYFYKFVYYYFRDHLDDAWGCRKFIRERFENWLQILTNIVVIVFIISFIVSYILCYNIPISKWLTSGIVLLVTSLITGSFFLVKIYIENQLSKKEKEMLKEYQIALEKQIREQRREQNEKFEEQNKKFKEQNQKIDLVLDWVKSQQDSKAKPTQYKAKRNVKRTSNST